ncbi:MAG: PHP domain-containing protein [Candidatus Cloacimonetes bacterium]|nr:PHP domain-containing protein [Candidatus Cloacimonadota bacterium]
MKKIDLHIHTTYSDGTYTPKEIIQAVRDLEFSTIAITDHDTIDGYLAARRYARKYDIDLIPAVEISSYFQSYDIHILAYFIDIHNKKLTTLLNFTQKARTKRAKQILEKLEEFDIFLTMKQVYEFVGNKKVISRPHIANAMLKNGFIENYEEAYYKYIGNDSPAYVCKPTYKPVEIFQIVKEAGGLSVLAHPGVIKNDFLIPELVELGLDGLEIFYPLHTIYQKNIYLELAHRYNLLITGGSDFHGNNKKNNELGRVTLKEEYLERLKSKWKEMN